MHHASWIREATFFEIAVYITDNWRKTSQANAITIRSNNFANRIVELLPMLSRCGHEIAFSQLADVFNTAICNCLQKMALKPDNEVLFPENIQTTLACG